MTQRPKSSIRNMGPKSTKWLNEIGVSTLQDIERLGSVEVYIRLKRIRPRVSLVLLYALEAALLDLHWNRLPGSVKAELREAARLKQ